MMEFGTAAILCGGKSSRMGFDKSEIRVNGKLLVEIIGERLEQVFNNIILIADDKEKFKNIKYKVVQDIVPQVGPMGGIYTALNYSDSKFVFVTACDMPFVNLDYIKYMMNCIEGQNFQGVVSCKGGYVEPLYSFYSKEMMSTFRNELDKNNYKVFQVIKSCNFHYVKEEKIREYSKDMSIFANLNYKSDLGFLKCDLMGG
jgi:molybdopterin-guanine dinucleotide biosynthesis protein A